MTIQLRSIFALGALSLAAIATQAQDSPSGAPSTPPSTMPGVAGYSPPDASRDAVTDATITTSLLDALDRDVDLGPLKLNVDSSDRNVSLHGVVPSAQLRDRATGIAAAVPGIRTIENDLVVQP